MIRGEHPRLGTFVFDDDLAGYYVPAVQIGAPQVRGVVRNRPNSDGTDDETSKVGSRAISFLVVVAPKNGETNADLWDRLAGWLDVGLRFDLVIAKVRGGAERRIRVRPGDNSELWENPARANFPLTFITVGSPFWRSIETTTVTAEPGLDNALGRGYDLVFDRVYPEAGNAGAVTATQRGNRRADVVIDIYGPCVGPSIRSLTAPGRLDFPTLTIAAGTFLRLDSAEFTALLNGSPGANRLHLLDYSTRQWFGALPGLNEFRFVVEESGEGCHATITFADTNQ